MIRLDAEKVVFAVKIIDLNTEIFIKKNYNSCFWD